MHFDRVERTGGRRPFTHEQIVGGSIRGYKSVTIAFP